MKTRYAVILVAGEGKRLRPITETMPKCLVEVCGRSILENALTLFADRGVQTTRIVIGHLAHVVQERIGTSFKGMKIEYVENPDYANTNSMYSLHLGLQGLNEATWLLEGDVFFEAKVLSALRTHEISWFVDAVRKDLDGAYIRFDEGRRALSLDIIRDVNLVAGLCGKSIGLLHMDKSGVERFRHWLEIAVAAGHTDLYYDLIVGPHFGDAFVEVVDVGGFNWFEIDNFEDLENARRMFA